jgi:hypothetical protein
LFDIIFASAFLYIYSRRSLRSSSRPARRSHGN